MCACSFISITIVVQWGISGVILLHPRARMKQSNFVTGWWCNSNCSREVLLFLSIYNIISCPASIIDIDLYGRTEWIRERERERERQGRERGRRLCFLRGFESHVLFWWGRLREGDLGHPVLSEFGGKVIDPTHMRNRYELELVVLVESGPFVDDGQRRCEATSHERTKIRSFIQMVSVQFWLNSVAWLEIKSS